MRRDPLDQLRAENPLPELLPGLPLEVIRQRLDLEQPVARGRNRRPRWAFRPALMTLSIAGCVVAGIVFVIVNSLPAGSLNGFSLTDAKAALRHGELAVRASGRSVLYTQAALTLSGPRERTKHSVQRLWQTTGAWRVSDTSPTGPGRRGLTDAAFLGGITEYYVPSHHTLYVNRPRHPVSVNGALPSPDPVELAIGAVLNVEPPNASASASSFADAVRQLMAIPGAHVKRSDGLLMVSVTRARHSSRLVARLGSDKPVVIRQVEPGPAGTHRDYIDTWHFSAYRQALPAAAAAKALDLLRIYPHAKVVILHRSALVLP